MFNLPETSLARENESTNEITDARGKGLNGESETVTFMEEGHGAGSGTGSKRSRGRRQAGKEIA